MRTRCFEPLPGRAGGGEGSGSGRGFVPSGACCCPFQGGTAVLGSQFYMLLHLYPCVYRLQQSGHLKNSCPFCFLFSSIS